MSLIFEFSILKLGYTDIFMKICAEKFWPIFRTFLTSQGKNKDENEKTWKNKFNFWILRIKIRLCGSFLENLGKTFFDPFSKTFLTNQGKNEDKDEKIRENDFDFWILHMKSDFIEIFMKISGEKILTHFLGHFWLVKAKMKMKITRFGKISSGFEFSISILGYAKIFMKIWGKIFWFIFKPFLTNQGKNEDEDEKIWQNVSNFWILHIKIRICGNFHENLRKKFWTHFLWPFWLIKAIINLKTKKCEKMSSISEFSISKLDYMEVFIKIWGKRFFSKFLPAKDIQGQRCWKG